MTKQHDFDVYLSMKKRLTDCILQDEISIVLRFRLFDIIVIFNVYILCLILL